MKRIKYFLFTLLIGLVGILNANAASVSVKANNTGPTVGSTVKVTVTVGGTGTSAGKVGAWEYCVSYDSSKLTLTSPSSSCVLDGIAGFTAASTTFTFKVNATGSSTVSVKNVALYDFKTEEKIAANAGSVTITGKTQADISNPKTDTPKSKNAYLKTLEVVGYTLTPEFKKDVTNYEVTVPSDVSEVAINAFKEDMTSTIRTPDVRDIDHIALTEGINKIEISVTAQAGNKVKYIVNIIREEDNPLTVKVDGKDYAVLKSLENITVPRYYSEGTMEIDEQTVPVLESDVIGYKLIALKDEEGNVNLYYEDNGNYKKYIEITDESLVLIPANVREYVKGYEQSKEIKIGSNDALVYYDDANSDFVLLYATNVSNGETAWYVYDIKEGTLQRYVSKEGDAVKETSSSNYLTLGFAFVALVGLIVIFILMGMNSKLKLMNEKLYEKLKEKKVKVLEHPSFEEKDAEEEIEEKEEVVEETSSLDDTIDDDEFFARDEEDTMTKINRDVIILEDKPKKERKKTKAERKQEEAELKAMREDFLKTRELEITKEIKIPKASKKTLKKKKK